MGKPARIIPYLSVGNAREAIAFYEDAFDAEVDMVLDAADGRRVLHAAIEIEDNLVYLCDHFAELETGVSPPAGSSTVTLHVSLKKPKQVDRMMRQAVEAGAEIIMPASDVDGGARYGRLRDPFGHVWSFDAPLKKKRREEENGDEDREPGGAGGNGDSNGN
jgi:PhnB protein